jgi:hypothetical protein
VDDFRFRSITGLIRTNFWTALAAFGTTGGDVGEAHG